MFASDHHSVTRCHWFYIWYTFDDTKCFITEEGLIYTLLALGASRSVACLGSRVLVDVYLDRWAFLGG